MILYQNSIAFELARDLVVTGNMAYSTLKLYPHSYESVKDAAQKLVRANYVGIIKAPHIKVLHVTPQGKKAVDEALARIGLAPLEKAPIVYHPPKADRAGKINEAAMLFRLAGHANKFQTCLEIKHRMEEEPRGGDKLRYSRFVGVWEKEERVAVVYNFGKKNNTLNKNGETNAIVVARELYSMPVDRLILGETMDTMRSILEYSKMLETMPSSKRRKIVKLHFHIRPSKLDDDIFFLPVIPEAVWVVKMMGHHLWRETTDNVAKRLAGEGCTVWGLLDCRMRPPLEHLLYPNQVKTDRIVVACFDWQEAFVRDWYADLSERFEILVKPLRVRSLLAFLLDKTEDVVWGQEYRL